MLNSMLIRLYKLLGVDGQAYSKPVFSTLSFVKNISHFKNKKIREI